MKRTSKSRSLATTRLVAAALFAASLLSLSAALTRAEDGSPLPRAKPEAVGMSATRLAAMGEFFRREAERGAAAGYTILVARDGKLVYSAAVGMRDRENAVPMSLDTRYRIFSMSKPVTSVAVLMLYEEGKLQLDDPVSRFLPAFADMRVFTGVDAAGNIQTEPAREPITIRHLLSHTGGFGYGAGYDRTSPLGPLWAGVNLGGELSSEEKIRKLAALPLYFQPGTRWRYSYATDVLGYLVEVVSGVPFAQFLQTRLFDPLGMSHTGFHVAAADAKLTATAGIPARSALVSRCCVSSTRARTHACSRTTELPSSRSVRWRPCSTPSC